MTTFFFLCEQTSQSLQYFKGKPTDGVSCVPVPYDYFNFYELLYFKLILQKLQTFVLQINTVKLGYNKLGYNERFFWSKMVILLHKLIRL